MSYRHDYKQNLDRWGPEFSELDQKRAQMVKMIKSHQIKYEPQIMINQNIPGLRKKKTPFVEAPSSFRWWQSLGSMTRDGQVNMGLSRNWVRFMFPIMPAFFMIYMMNPVIHGVTYINHF